jgi:hypothetical protein
MPQQLRTNPVNVGTSVVDQVMTYTVQFRFKPSSNSKRGSKLGRLKYLMWDVTANKAADLQITNKKTGKETVLNGSNSEYTEIMNSGLQKLDTPSGWFGHKGFALIEQGHTIGIYLNNDTEPNRRKHCLYQFVVEANSVVAIEEDTAELKYVLTGNELPPEGNTQPDHTKIKKDISTDSKGRPVHYISSHLTGRTWLLITHKYTEQEARQMLGASSYPAAVQEAVLKIFNGQSFNGVSEEERKTLESSSPKWATRNRHSITLKNNNNQDLIVESKEGGGDSNYELMPKLPSIEVMARTSPLAYAAIAHAAASANITHVGLSSAWRAIFGSTLHREGRALDVSEVNRTGVVRDENSFEKTNPHKTEILALANLRLKQARGGALTEQEQENLKKWTEVEGLWLGSPVLRLFRQKLQDDRNVVLIYDPWLMDKEPGDTDAGKVNDGEVDKPKNKRGDPWNHRHHFHITSRA